MGILANVLMRYYDEFDNLLTFNFQEFLWMEDCETVEQTVKRNIELYLEDGEILDSYEFYLL